MKMIPAILLCVLVWPAWSQVAQYKVPKYPAAYKRTSRDSGPLPGSTVPDKGASSATYRRVYVAPAGLRLLVRAECGEQIGRNELIQRAQQASEAEGPPVQLDWGTVKNEKVVFWAVVSTSKTITTVDLSARDGRYKVINKRKSVEEDWHVQKLSIGKEKSLCLLEKEMIPKDLARAVTNLLNHQTLVSRRKALSADQGTGD